MDKLIADIQGQCKPDDIIIFPDMTLIAVVGRGMARTKGISGRIFTALANNGIRIRMISQDSSELNLIIAVGKNDFNKAIETV